MSHHNSVRLKDHLHNNDEMRILMTHTNEYADHTNYSSTLSLLSIASVYESATICAYC